MALQPLTPEQRAEALAKSKIANAERAKAKNALKAGTATLASVIASADTIEAVGKMRVSQLIQALPGVGRVRAQQVMERIGIQQTRRVRGLGPKQRAALEREFADA